MMLTIVSFCLLVSACLPCALTSHTFPKLPRHCGKSPNYPKVQIVGGFEIPPDEYSWLASLQYGHNNSYGQCGGSVINARYVLTAAHCVTGRQVDLLGGLTGVRLGDFTFEPYCDYGSSNCRYYQHFGVDYIHVHENYFEDSDYMKQNDIALVRLDRNIHFNHVMRPICLPLKVRSLHVDTILTTAGWGNTMTMDYMPAKRAVDIPIWNKIFCNLKGKICAGRSGKGSCQGDSGSPLMLKSKRWTIVGIVSQSQSLTCASEWSPVYFTDVRNYIDWILSNMHMGW